MPRARDTAGNIWETDAQGNPVRLLQPAAGPSFPGSIPGVMGVVPPNPAQVAEQQRTEARQTAADRRAEEENRRAAAREGREQAKFEREDVMAEPPGDTRLTGEDYLKTLPTGLAAQVKALSEGRRAFPTGAALRSPAVQQLVAAATQYDPTLDAANAATRVATRKDFTSGKSAQNITALNTVLGHLGSLWRSAQDLHNRGFTPWNAVANAAESTVGNPALNNYNLARKAVADELERVFRQSGGNVSEIQEWKSTLSSSSSPEQFRGAMAKAVELLNSRLEALSAQYGQGMGRSADPMTFLKPHAQAVFDALGPGGSGILPDDKGPKAPPTVGPPPVGPGGGNSPKLPGGVPRADYSGMVGDALLGIATEGMRRVPDKLGAAALSAFIRKGAPYETAAAYAQSHGFNPPDPQTYAEAVGFAKEHNGAVNVEADRFAPTTIGERISASPVATAFAGGVSGATAGLSDVVGRTIAGPQWDANRAAMAALNRGPDIAGNLVGGVVGSLALPEIFARAAPGAAARLAGWAQRKPLLARLGMNGGYGATYGASENPDNPLVGAGMGGLTGLIAGEGGYRATRGLANVIAPPAGRFGPAYKAGVFPSVGQRFERSGFVGRAINTVEQAMQSFPGLGALVSRARQIPRDQFQLGAFNDALGDIGQRLPDGMVPGTEPHAFASQAFNSAYDRARSGMRFAPDEAYLADEQAFNQALGDGTLDSTQANQVRQRIATAVGSRLGSTARRRATGALEGDAYKNAASALQQTQREWAKSDPLKANALNDYLTIFDNAARRNSNPQAVQLLDNADLGYAKLVRIQNAAARVGGDSGTFSPKAFDRSVQQTAGGVRSGPYLRGDALMQDFADAGRGLVDTLPNSGSADRLLTGQAVAGTGGFALGAPAAIAAHPGSLAPFALYAPGVNRLVTRAIAPREYTLPPVFSQPLNFAGRQLNQIAPFVGQAVVPGALAYRGVGQ